jgi:hypothetical protein
VLRHRIGVYLASSIRKDIKGKHAGLYLILFELRQESLDGRFYIEAKNVKIFGGDHIRKAVLADVPKNLIAFAQEPSAGNQFSP